MFPSKQTEHFVAKACKFLRREGYLCTPLRQNMLRIFFTDSHIRVKHLKAQLQERYECKTSTQSLYSNIRLLTRLNLICKTGDMNSYELHFKRNHIHMICRQCGRVNELHDRIVFDTIRKQCRNFTFEAFDVDITLYGICTACQK